MSKIVLITGGSIGIGRATCIELSKLGFTIIFSYYKDEEEAKLTAEKCQLAGAKEVFYHYLDLTNDDSIKKFAADVVGKYGKIDVLVNNAGVIAWKPLKEQSFEEITMQLRVNLEGLIKITKILLPYVKEKIINISSGAGKTAFADLTTYCATKFGVRGFTQALAKEISNPVCIVVNPDMTQTRMTDFRGRPPEDVAEVIRDVITDKIKVYPGEDIDVWKYK